MSDRNRELLRFYEENRINDQLKFYANRRDMFDRAAGQALSVSAVLLGFATATGALAGAALGGAKWWSAAAAILAAASTALAAYTALYAFDQQSKIYGDAVRAVHAASRPRPDPDVPQDGHTPEQNIAALVKRVENTLRKEQSQWGQLTVQFRLDDQAEE